jgi:hypothetical protein
MIPMSGPHWIVHLRSTFCPIEIQDSDDNSRGCYEHGEGVFSADSPDQIMLEVDAASKVYLCDFDVHSGALS